jgi:hypothetical protein
MSDSRIISVADIIKASRLESKSKLQSLGQAIILQDYISINNMKVSDLKG